MHAPDISAPWAIQPDYLARIESLSIEHARTLASNPEAIASRAAPATSTPKVQDGIATIELAGPLTKNYNWLTAIMGGTSMQHAGALIAQAAQDPNVKGILLAIDSPGGTVDGTEALARTIREAASQKQVMALAGGVMASAAYWAGSAAGAVYLESGTTVVGSIGVVSKHTDISGLESRIGIKTTEIASGKFKRIASVHEPLSQAGRDSIQTQLDYIYGLFVQAVATHRGASVQAVLDRMADGRLFTGQQAITAGLADGFASRAELIERMRAGRAAPVKPSSSTSHATMTKTEQVARAQAHAKTHNMEFTAAFKALGFDKAPTAAEAARPPAHASLTPKEQVAQAQAYADEHGVDFVRAMKTLGFAK